MQEQFPAAMAGKNAKTVSLTGKIACHGDDDCTFQTADAKSSRGS